MNHITTILKKLSTTAVMASMLLFMFGTGEQLHAQYDGSGTFVEVTDIGDLTDGYYVVTDAQKSFVMTNDHNGTFLVPDDITLVGGNIIDPSADIVWLIETNDGGRTMYNEVIERYVAQTSNSNSVQITENVDGDAQRWTFAYESDEFTATNMNLTNRILKYNASAPRFASYTSGQRNLQLYKLSDTATPVLVPSETSLDFSYNEGDGPSASQSFTLNGSDLDPEDATITLTAPEHFEISLNDTDFFSERTVDAVGGEINAVTVYVRLEEGKAIDIYSGSLSIEGGDASASVSLSGNVVPDHDFLETFETPNYNLTGGYNDGSFEGVTGVTWTYVESRNDGGYPINGDNAIMLRRSSDNSSLTSDVISGGIDEFSVLLRKGFTGSGNRQVELLIGSDAQNLESIELSEAYDVDDEIRRFTVTNIDHVGDFVMRIANVRSGQIVIDDISWKSLPGASTQLTGNEGFRMLTAPVATSFANFLEPIWTQGASGADYPMGSPNVFTWDNTSTDGDVTNWTGLTNLYGNVTPGTGFLVYVYEDHNNDGSEVGFPRTLQLTGAEHAADVTPTINSNTDGFTMLGNPFASTVDFNNIVRADLTDVVYVWNPDGNVWDTYEADGGAGNLTNGLIAPFQGFMVQTSDAAEPSPSVTIGDAAKSSGGTFRGKGAEQERMIVRFEMDNETKSSSTWLRFSENGSLDKQVRGDALKLQPLSSSYAQLATSKSDETLYDISHLPLSDEAINIPLHVSSTANGTFTLRATDFELPEGFELTFNDHATGESIPVTQDFEYQIELGAAKANSVPPLKRLTQEPMVAKASPESADYSFTAKSAMGTNIDDPYGQLPEQVTLNQNYPNPFNPSTTISYQLPANSHVTLQVFDMLGRQVATLVDGQVSAGTHQATFDAGNLSSGMYIYRLQAGNTVLTKKLTLIK